MRKPSEEQYQRFLGHGLSLSMEGAEDLADHQIDVAMVKMLSAQTAVLLAITQRLELMHNTMAGVL